MEVPMKTFMDFPTGEKNIFKTIFVFVLHD